MTPRKLHQTFFSDLVFQCSYYLCSTPIKPDSICGIYCATTVENNNFGIIFLDAYAKASFSNDALGSMSNWVFNLPCMFSAMNQVIVFKTCIERYALRCDH